MFSGAPTPAAATALNPSAAATALTSAAAVLLPPVAATAVPTPAPSASLSGATIRQLASGRSRPGMNDPRIERKTKIDAARHRAGDDADAGLSGHLTIFLLLDHLYRDPFLSLPNPRNVQNRNARENRGFNIKEERPGALLGIFVAQLVIQQELAKCMDDQRPLSGPPGLPRCFAGDLNVQTTFG